MSEYIVIGAGLAGSATAWELARRGESVTVLERSTPANDRGSSHGSARIFRYAYPDQLYTDLVVRARGRWDELEAAAGRELITPAGCVDFGTDRHATVLAEALDRSGVEHELLTASVAAERWPQVRFEDDVLWHPGAGVIDAAGAVTSMIDLAVATGNARVLDQWPVARIERLADGGFRVHSDSTDDSPDEGFVDGSHVIVAAGGWLPAMIGDLALPAGFIDSLPRFEVREEQAFHMPYRDADANGAPSRPWPTFIHKSPEYYTYSLPGGRDAGFAGQKIAVFNGGPAIASALDQDGRVRADARATIIDYVDRFVPGLVPEPFAETTCLFTNTPTEDFLIDSVDGVTVVSACSGHGAKFAPLLGELAADLATGAGTVPDQFRAAAHAAAR